MKPDVKQAVKAAHNADRALSRRAAKAGDHPVVRITAAVGELADQPPLIMATAATAIGGIAFGNPGVTRVGVRMLASHLLATGIKLALKTSIDRTRPDAAHHGRAYRLKRGGDHGHDLASFPSGHTAGAVAVARALMRDVPAATPVATLAAGTVAAIQLPNAKHYASDVAAGAVIGVVSEWLVSAALDRAERRLRAIRPALPSASRPGRSAPT